MEDRLSIWLNDQLKERGWSMRELARRAGVSGASVSLLISGQMNVSADMCRKLARALDISPEEVMRRAGILDPLPDDLDKRQQAELLEAMRRLTPEERRRVIEYVKFVESQRLIATEPGD